MKYYIVPVENGNPHDWEAGIDGTGYRKMLAFSKWLREVGSEVSIFHGSGKSSGAHAHFLGRLPDCKVQRSALLDSERPSLPVDYRARQIAIREAFPGEEGHVAVLVVHCRNAWAALGLVTRDVPDVREISKPRGREEIFPSTHVVCVDTATGFVEWIQYFGTPDPPT